MRRAHKRSELRRKPFDHEQRSHNSRYSDDYRRVEDSSPDRYISDKREFHKARGRRSNPSSMRQQGDRADPNTLHSGTWSDRIDTRRQEDRSERNRPSPELWNDRNNRMNTIHQTKLHTDGHPENCEKFGQKRKYPDDDDDIEYKFRRSQQNDRINCYPEEYFGDMSERRNDDGHYREDIVRDRERMKTTAYDRYDQQFQHDKSDDHVTSKRDRSKRQGHYLKDFRDDSRELCEIRSEFLRHESVHRGERFSIERYEELPIVKDEVMGKDEFGDLVSNLLNIVLKHGGESSVQSIEAEFESCYGKRFRDEHHIGLFLDKLPHVFEFHVMNNEVEIVRAKTEVKLCPTHSKKPTTCSGKCQSLHMCKYFLLSSCEMKNCKFNHNFSDNHNLEVQKRYYLQNVDLSNLRLLLQHDANRCQVTVPIICKYYNENRCRSNQNQACPFLHICRNYVQDTCYQSDRCKLNHNLSHNEVLGMLCKYGLDPNVLFNGVERIRSLLRWSINDFKETDMKRQGYRSGIMKKDTGKTTGSWGTGYILSKPNRELSRPFLSLDKISNDSSTETEDSSDREDITSEGTMTIETTSKCNTSDSKGNDKNLHSWFITMKNNESLNVKKSVSKDIEKRYQIYLSAKTSVFRIDGKRIEIDFSKLEANFVGSSYIDKNEKTSMVVKRQEKPTKSGERKQENWKED